MRGALTASAAVTCTPSQNIAATKSNPHACEPAAVSRNSPCGVLVDVVREIKERLRQAAALDEEKRNEASADAPIAVQKRVNRLKLLVHQRALTRSASRPADGGTSPSCPGKRASRNRRAARRLPWPGAPFALRSSSASGELSGYRLIAAHAFPSASRDLATKRSDNGSLGNRWMPCSSAYDVVATSSKSSGRLCSHPLPPTSSINTSDRLAACLDTR